jgi:hypothetical protein
MLAGMALGSDLADSTPLGSWARLKQHVVARLPDVHGLAISRLLSPGTVLRVLSEKGAAVRVRVGCHEQTVVRGWLEPAEPPPTAWERLGKTDF